MWSWESFENDLDLFYIAKTLEGGWSCGVTKTIKTGDRVFLMRLGEAPKGIMASGRVLKGSYKSAHWADDSKETLYIDIRFDNIVNPKKTILSLDQLKIINPNLRFWTPRASGKSIPLETAAKLEKIWGDFIEENIYDEIIISNKEIFVEEYFTEGGKSEFTSTRFERNPQAREKCLELHGYNCKVCGINFEKEYGEIGKGFIHVHHLKMLSEIGEDYQVDPKNDMVPLCPNCHCMIHKRKPLLSVEELKEIITRQKS